MTNPDPPEEAPSRESKYIPAARIAPRRASWSWAWGAPLVSIIVVAWLAYQAVSERGLAVQITFSNGRGISTNDPVSCRGVQVGKVERVRLDSDHNGVVIQVRLFPDAQSLAAEGTQFWIVRPEVSFKGVTGLDALLGPRYLEALPAKRGSPRRTAFEGLESPPPIGERIPGTLEVILMAVRRGSVTVGSPITYRDIRVGRVLEVRLGPDSTRVEVIAGIEPRYAPLVCENSRFWNTSGVGVEFDLFGGLTLRADSLESILTGGISFATPAKKPGDVVEGGHRFDLASAVDAEWLGWEPVIPLKEDLQAVEP